MFVAFFVTSTLPNDGDLGEFPVLNPIVSVLSTPRIPSELKGKGIDPAEIPHNRGNVDEPNDWFNQWSDLDDHVAKLSKPGPGESEDSLQDLWDDNNQRESIQVQNLALRWFRKAAKEDIKEHLSRIDMLQEQVRGLEKLVIQNQLREDEACRQVTDTHHAPTARAPQTTDPPRPIKPEKVKSSAKDRGNPPRVKSVESS
ncbi:hypothetical protein DFJ58DRAFT_893529 [Suillus subalutaceus]|uniref:uncharacterized protein n=1 Tax=Suillus subalutaceus TaxID=48586 RepID=UPI001B87494D|nr:uncharacterized protein DFJ58DRAFT_893529 [Suillus subalutaceus]KAG1845719.1 hypothetical protein DFJ58DRAFT_893529 [Suillus subalutaceus]